MPGIFILVDSMGETLAHAKEMCRRLSHDKDWFGGKIYRIQNGHYGIVNFKSQLEGCYAVSDTGIQVLVYGEVYPYHSDGTHVAPTNSAEFVFSLYEQHGTKFVDYLNGSFCISIYDDKAKRLVLATDRFGSKPLYRDTRSEKLIVSSEIKAVLVPSDPPEYNTKSIVNLFTFLHLLDNDTFFEGIEVLPPASVLIYDFDDNSIQFSSYWSYNLEDEPSELAHQPLETLVEQFDALMTDSIRRRMGDHRSIGVFLSGGIDSRLMTAYAKEIAEKTNKQLYAFTFGTENGHQYRPASRVAKALGVEHNFYVIPADTIAKYAWEVVWNGDGHLRIRDAHFIAWLETIQEKVDLVLAGYVSGLYFGSHVTERMLQLENKRELADYMYERVKVDFRKAHSLLTDGFISDFERDAKRNFEATIDNIPSEVLYKVAHYWDVHQRARRYLLPITNYPRWYLPCSDPCVDNHVTDFAFSLPVELFLRKRFLHKVQEIRFPMLNDIEFETVAPLSASEVGRFLFRLRRYILRKMVFAIQKYSRGKILIKNRDYRAYDYWLRTDSKEFVQNILSDSSYFQGLFLKQSPSEKMLEEHLTCQEDHNQLICDVLTFIMMHHYFVNTMSRRQRPERIPLPLGPTQ